MSRARGGSYFKSADDGSLDTGYPCRPDPQTGALVVTGPPAGLVSVGGYRFCMREVQRGGRAGRQGRRASRPFRMPSPGIGSRVTAKDRAAMREALTEIGLNPLIVRAFRERGAPAAA